MTSDHKSKWQQELMEIASYFRVLMNDTHMFKRTQEIIGGEGERVPPEISYFNSFLARGYIYYSSISIRRLIKCKDNLSMVKLLCDIKQNCKELDIAESEILADISAIKNTCNIVADYCDKKIAHLDKNGMDKPVYYRNVYNSVSLIEKMMKKYFEKLGIALPLDNPALTNSWELAFTVPWKKTS